MIWELRSMISKIQKFFDDVKKEMSKVSWPTREELSTSTLVVVVVTFLFTVFIFVADLVFSTVLQYLY
jgi:preprotein translocase subunit SecE